MSTLVEIYEKVTKKTVYRQGKRMKKKVSDRPGYKIVDGKEKKMSAQEMRNRKISQKKGAKKRKASKNKSTRQLKQTLRKKGNK